MKLFLDQKLAGVLVPVFALRGTSDLGIGDTVAVKEMIDWCARHGFRVLQMLPIKIRSQLSTVDGRGHESVSSLQR